MALSEDVLQQLAGDRIFLRGEDHVRYVHGLHVVGNSAQAKRTYAVRLNWSRTRTPGILYLPALRRRPLLQALVALGPTAIDEEHRDLGTWDRFAVDTMLLELADHRGDVDGAIGILARGEHPRYVAVIDRLRAAGRDDEVLCTPGPMPTRRLRRRHPHAVRPAPLAHGVAGPQALVAGSTAELLGFPPKPAQAARWVSGFRRGIRSGSTQRGGINSGSPFRIRTSHSE